MVRRQVCCQRPYNRGLGMLNESLACRKAGVPELVVDRIFGVGK